MNPKHQDVLNDRRTMLRELPELLSKYGSRRSKEVVVR